MLRALGLAAPFPDVATALAHHGYVQLDPINVCGRMHDLILRNRVTNYREGDLQRHLHGHQDGSMPAARERRAFEHYCGVLAALPIDAWPFLVDSMRSRRTRSKGWAGRLNREEQAVARQILRALERRGPLSSDDIEHGGRSVTAWNSKARLAKVVLEKLFLHGRVLIATRRAFRRVYDLPERVLPPELLARPLPSPEESRRWRIQLKLRQRRLVRLSRGDAAAVADLVLPVRIEGGGLYYHLREDAVLLDESVAPRGESSQGLPLLLAPLDPLIYDRELTRQLWDFDYVWEVYTPPAKRVRGYYALPVLAGGSIAGHTNPRIDRESARLRVSSRRVKRGVTTVAAEKALAHFLGLPSGRAARRPVAGKAVVGRRPA
jgi:uncharacterized protein YcaQ